MKNNKSAILLLTHVKNRSISDQFSKIVRECSQKLDVFFLCDNTSRKFDRHRKDEKFFLFDVSTLANLDYPGKSSSEILLGPWQNDRYHQRFNFNPGNVELPVLQFFKERSHYDYYWIVEYDVRFSGSWDSFFSAFERNESDLLGTTLTRFEKVPDWHHWPTLDLAGRPVCRDRYIRGFFPVYRLSRRALAQLDRDYRDGVKGHFEGLVPTLLDQAGMTIEDIGGDGDFVQPGNRNRFYRNTPARHTLMPGTFVFRPAMDRPGDEPNKLWHPVKYSPLWRVALRRLKRSLLQPTRGVDIPGAAAAARTASDAIAPLEPSVANPGPGDRPN